jgi:hypothetical protein
MPTSVAAKAAVVRAETAAKAIQLLVIADMTVLLSVLAMTVRGPVTAGWGVLSADVASRLVGTQAYSEHCDSTCKVQNVIGSVERQDVQR